jgi:hypothetical protein
MHNIDELENWANENYRLSTMTTKGERENPHKMTITYLHWLVPESRIYPIHTHTHLFDNPNEQANPNEPLYITLEQIESYFRLADNYNIHEILTYCVDIEPDNVPAFIANPITTDHLKRTKPPITKIEIPPSLFIFHEVNVMYVILVDKPPVKKASSMKTKRAPNSVHKTTKRVSFNT